jgi:hypothetical protein
MHQLLAHPLFEEREAWEILAPFGFEVDVRSTELPDEDDNPEEFAQFSQNVEAYIEALEHTPPAGFTEVARFETEDADIVFVSVRAKTAFADCLLYSDPAFDKGPELTQAAFDVIGERFRQLDDEGFSCERDSSYQRGELAAAAAAYASVAATVISEGKTNTSHMLTTAWPFDRTWWKPTTPRRDLVKAGALILAEIERLDRAAAHSHAEEVAQ